MSGKAWDEDRIKAISETNSVLMALTYMESIGVDHETTKFILTSMDRVQLMLGLTRASFMLTGVAAESTDPNLTYRDYIQMVRDGLLQQSIAEEVLGSEVTGPDDLRSI